MPRALASINAQQFERAVAEGLGINLEEALGGTLIATHEGGNEVKITWECIKVITLDEFNEILRKAQQA